MTPKFRPGRLLMTPGALHAFQNAQEPKPWIYFHRHLSGDWGDLGDEDKAENDLSVKQGFRILSAYTLTTGIRIWVITEADRSATTFLLPEEY